MNPNYDVNEVEKITKRLTKYQINEMREKDQFSLFDEYILNVSFSAD